MRVVGARFWSLVRGVDEDEGVVQIADEGDHKGEDHDTKALLDVFLLPTLLVQDQAIAYLLFNP